MFSPGGPPQIELVPGRASSPLGDSDPGTRTRHPADRGSLGSVRLKFLKFPRHAAEVLLGFAAKASRPARRFAIGLGRLSD